MENFREELNGMYSELHALLGIKKNELQGYEVTAHQHGLIKNREKDLKLFEEGIRAAVYHPTTLSNFRKSFTEIQQLIEAI